MLHFVLTQNYLIQQAHTGHCDNVCLINEDSFQQSHGGVCVCVVCTSGDTHGLQGLEAAVEDEVPDDFTVLEGRDVPYEEISEHSQRGRQDDPADGQKKAEEAKRQWKNQSVKHSQHARPRPFYQARGRALHVSLLAA